MIYIPILKWKHLASKKSNIVIFVENRFRSLKFLISLLYNLSLKLLKQINSGMYLQT